MSDADISSLAKKIKLKLSVWIPQTHEEKVSSYVQNYFSMPSREPSKFITHHNLWDRLGDRAVVGEIVLKQIEQFSAHYSQLPITARRVIAKTIQRANLPKWLSWKIEINLQELELYLSTEERHSFDNIITLLKNKDIAHVTEQNHQFSEQGEDIYVICDRYLTLSWRMSEPDYDMFTALKSFYLAHFSEQRLFHAFEFCDFSDIS